MKIALTDFANSPSRVWQPWFFIVIALVLGVLLSQLPLTVAAGMVVGTAVLLLIIIEPLVGLSLALLVGPWGALESLLRGSTLLDSGQLLLLLTLAVWMGRGLSRRPLVIPRAFLTLPLLLFLGVTAVTLLDAPSLDFGFKELLKWIEVLVVMLLVLDCGWDEKTGKPRTAVILGMLLLAGVSQALVGIWQFGLRGDGPEHFLVLGRFYRAYGTFEQPNPFGGFVNLTAMLAIGTTIGLLVFLWQAWREKRPLSIHLLLLFLVIGGCALATSLAVIFSWSRGAWLSFGAGTAVVGLLWPRKSWQGLLLLAVIAVLFVGGVQTGVVPDSVVTRITSFTKDFRLGDVRGVDINDDNYAVLERLAHWQAALNMARDNIWLGVGFGNYEPAYADYALLNWPFPLGHAHNYYLNLLAETGVLGLLAYGVLWTAVFWQTFQLIRRLPWPYRGMALGLMGVWVGLSVHHLVDKLYVNNIYIHLGVLLGLLQLLEYIGLDAEKG